jgi:hypothetical protein
MGKSFWPPVQQQRPQKEIQKTSLSAQAPSSSVNDMLKVVTVVQQIITELSEAITKMVLILMKQNGCSSSQAAQSHSICRQRYEHSK